MEIWKDIKGYEGHYQVSNLGRVKSLNREINRGGVRGNMLLDEKILKQSTHHKGYRTIQFKVDGKIKTYKIHQLVAMSFLGHTPCGMSSIIDHIDNNKSNNNVSNLRIVSNRENTSKGKLVGKSSKYTGVSFNRGKWVSFIQVDKKNKYLGRFNDEYEAHLAYKSELEKITNN
jgi:hypothetical protein